MAVGDTGADSARGWRERVRGGTKELRGEVARLGARRIERGGEDVAGAADGGSSLELSSAACSARARKGNGEAKSDLAIAMAVESLSGARSRRHGDAWRCRLCTPSPWQEQGRHSTEFECFLIKF